MLSDDMHCNLVEGHQPHGLEHALRLTGLLPAAPVRTRLGSVLHSMCQ